MTSSVEVSAASLSATSLKHFDGAAFFGEGILSLNEGCLACKKGALVARVSEQTLSYVRLNDRATPGSA
jgi:hypothetical protein